MKNDIDKNNDGKIFGYHLSLSPTYFNFLLYFSLLCMYLRCVLISTKQMHDTP